MLKIRQIQKNEINLIQNFPPKEWNIDLSSLVSFHFGYSYFYPIVAEVDNKIAGFGEGILTGKIGWIGNILVLSEYRKQGIGYELTSHLVEYLKNKGCTSQLLIASDMGRNIYSRMGFNVTSSYQFYKSESDNMIYKPAVKPRRIKIEDFPFIKEFDKEITGEDRYPLIERFFHSGWIYSDEESNEIKGLYLPDLGSGLVLAKDPEVGLELTKFRLSQGKSAVIIPSENKTAKEFLEREGFQKYMELPRMVLGNEVNWKPEFVFNRAAGYCG